MSESRDQAVYHHRRSLRLKGADYSHPGLYFVTICAASRRTLFGHIESNHMVLSRIGEIAHHRWLEIPRHFPQIDLHAFVVMPNHLHGILDITVGARYIVPLRRKDGFAEQAEQFGKPTIGSLPTIIRTYKAAVSREIRTKFGGRYPAVWQRNYYERVLRDGKEFSDAS